MLSKRDEFKLINLVEIIKEKWRKDDEIGFFMIFLL